MKDKRLNNIIFKLNLVGSQKENEWEQFKFLKKEDDFIFIKNTKTAEIKTYSYSRYKYLSKIINNKISPFSLRKNMPDLYIKEQINKKGLGYKNKFEQYKFISLKRIKKDIIIEIQNIYGREIVKSKYRSLINENNNPFRQTHFKSSRLLKELVQKESKKYTKWFKFKFIKKSERPGYIILENLKTKERKETLMKSVVNRGCNPFDLSNGYSNIHVTYLLNNFGKKYKNRFEKFKVLSFEGNGKKKNSNFN